MCDSTDIFGVIYLATNKVNGLLYIGQTKDFSKRIILYRNRMKKPRAWFERALAKYGIDGFEWKIIDEAKNPQELDDKERKWIAHYKTTDNSVGYNLTHGGLANRMCTDQCRENMSEAAKRKFANGYVHPSIGITPQPHVIEAAQRGLRKMLAERGHPNKGKKLTSEQCLHASVMNRGKHSSPRTEFPSRSVLCVELNKIFPSLQAAGRHFGKNASGLCICLKGKTNSWAGYHWRYLFTELENLEDSAFPSFHVQSIDATEMALTA